MPSTPEETVTVLLDAAGLQVTAEEMAQFVADYPAWRASIDALYAVPMAHDEHPQFVFRPTM